MKFLVIKIIGILFLDAVHLISSQYDAVELISQKKPTDMGIVFHDNTLTNGNGVDGNKSSYFETEPTVNSWFLINLVNVYKISYIIIFNRQDSNGERLAKVNISIGNGRRSLKQCGYFAGPGETGGIYNITCVGTGKFVFLQQGVNKRFHLAEIEVYGTELEIPIISGQCLDIRFEEQNYYEGTLSIAVNGTKCIDFNITYPRPNVGYFPGIFNSKSYKNYCRNPNNYIHHWCYISKSEWKECNLRRCTTVEDYSKLLSHRKPTEMSSYIIDFFDFTSHDNGVDGMHNNFFSTDVKDMSWWRVDLIELCEIRFILMFNRHNVYGLELNTIQINIGENVTNFIQCAKFEGPSTMRKMHNITCKAVGKIVELKQHVYENFQLSEVEVYGKILESSPSLSYRKPADISSIHDTSFSAELGVDGYTNTYFQTRSNAINWWRVDLIDFYEIKLVQISTPKKCCGERLRNVTISVGGFKGDVKRCAFYEGPGVTGEVYDIKCKCLGRIVQLIQMVSDLVLSEVAVYGDKLVDGNWAEWSPPYESAIDKTCTKTRTCTNPKPQHGGQDCLGLSIFKCPNIDGLWSQWTTCKPVCVPGIVECIKYRNCSNPSPRYAGKMCKGEMRIIKKCPIDGQWSEWSSCNSVCVPGVVECMKQRNCSNPSPQFNGTYCKGDNSMNETCPSVPAANKLTVYFIISPIIFVIIGIMVAWSILDDIKEKRREDKEYKMAMAGVLQHIVNTENPNPQSLNPNPESVNPNPESVNTNPESVNPNPQNVNPDPQINEEDTKIKN